MTWDETRVLHAKIGRSLVVARRRADTWYLGGMTAAQARQLELPLTFLGSGAFDAELYLDDAAGGSTSLIRRKEALSAAGMLRVVMPRSGGFAGVLKRTGP